MALLLAGAGPAAERAPSPQLFHAIAAADQRLETIGYRLATANVARCSRQMGATGIRFVTLSDFDPGWRSAAAAAFGLSAGAAVELVVPGSPAAAAGIQPGDRMVAIEGVPAGDPATSLLDLPPDATIRLTLERGGRTIDVRLQPRPACRARFQLMLGKKFVAQADDHIVRIGAGFVERLADDRLAAVVAHEFAHLILGHDERRGRERMRGGIAGELGRSAQATRALEDEADRLSLRLMAAAGYDPHAAVALWGENVPAIQGWLPRGPSHRGWHERAVQLEAELAVIGL